MTRPDPLRAAADQALIGLSLWFVATAPTPGHADAHVAEARRLGATDEQIDHALDLMRGQQAASVQVIHTHPLTPGEDALP